MCHRLPNVAKYLGGRRGQWSLLSTRPTQVPATSSQMEAPKKTQLLASSSRAGSRILVLASSRLLRRGTNRLYMRSLRQRTNSSATALGAKCMGVFAVIAPREIYRTILETFPNITLCVAEVSLSFRNFHWISFILPHKANLNSLSLPIMLTNSHEFPPTNA